MIRAFAPMIARPAAVAAILVLAAVAPAPAQQGVDRYEFLDLKKKVEQALDDLERMRNAMAGGNIQQRFSEMEDELSRLIGEVERLEFALRQHEDQARKKLEDLEYRIIELEGGDPSVLFQNNEEPTPPAPQSVPQIQPAPGGPAVQSRPLGQGDAGSSGGGQTGAQPGGSQTLGVLNRPVAGSDQYERGVAAMQSGRAEEARDILESFLSANPGSPVAGDAYFWLGEAYYSLGDFRQAARRYVDGAELQPGSSMAPRSLLKLGITLSLLGQTDVACRTFRAVGERYPNAIDTVSAADAEARRAGCG